MTELLKVLEDYDPVRMSNGQIRCMCPFRENHPDGSGRKSFFLSPELGVFHCFSCNAKGSAVRLLTRRFGVNYFDAMELVNLASVVGDKPKKPEFELDKSFTVPPPKYFLDRGYKDETLRHFRFGETDDGWMIIPFYRGRELVGFQQRKQTPDRIVRNNTGFNKKEYLYNYDDGYDYVVVVEGYSDVLRLYEHGYNATAVLGADVSRWQAQKISEFEHVYLAFDNDDAGRRATEIAYWQVSPHTDVKLIPYPTKDPGECVDKRTWAESFRDATDYAEYATYMAMYWDGYIEMREKVKRDLKHRAEDDSR